MAASPQDPRRRRLRVIRGRFGARTPEPAPLRPEPRQQESEPAEPAATDRALWRLRTTVRDEPGSLAAVCASLASHGVDVLSLQTHPLGAWTVDEFALRAPVSVDAATLTEAVGSAGGHDTWLTRADAHDLVDAPTRALELATRCALDPAELPLSLRQLLGRCRVRSVPPGTRPSSAEGALEGTVLRLSDRAGGELVVERPGLPFTPAEFARAQALTRLDARLGPRLPADREAVSLSGGDRLTVRRAGTDDLDEVRELHDRCSPRTLARRYGSAAADADRLLGHLLDPRFGRTLAARTPSGRLVALGHLLWDGEECEVALLVEDSWQRRGVGTELLRRLVAMAEEAGGSHVYALTQASNAGMAALMRGLDLPLEYQLEENTLVLTARLAGAAAPATW